MFTKFRLGKTCDVCGKKSELVYMIWLPNWRKFIYTCPSCTMGYISEEAFANDYELGNIKLVK